MSLFDLIFMYLISGKFFIDNPFRIIGVVAIVMGICGIIGFRMSWRFMKFVRLAEKIFEAFGWEKPRSIDLYEITKKNRQPDDSVLVGVVIFRK